MTQHRAQQYSHSNVSSVLNDTIVKQEEVDMTDINERKSGLSDLRSAGRKRRYRWAMPRLCRLSPPSLRDSCQSLWSAHSTSSAVRWSHNPKPDSACHRGKDKFDCLPVRDSLPLLLSPSLPISRPSNQNCQSESVFSKEKKKRLPTQKFKEGNHTGFTETLIAETLMLSPKTFKHGLKAVPTSEDSS